MEKSRQKLIIVDDFKPIGAEGHKVVYLNENNVQSAINLLKTTQKNVTLYQDKLLSFNESILSYYESMIVKESDFRYLLSFSIFEQSPYKTNLVNTLYKLFAVVEYIKSNKFDAIELFSSDERYLNFFHQYCQSNNLQFTAPMSQKRQRSLKKMIKKNFAISLILKFLLELKKMIFVGNKNHSTKHKVCVSYFPNYQLTKQGFKSKYYGDVSHTLSSDYDWLFIYAGPVKKLKHEQTVLQQSGLTNFNFLDAFFGVKDFVSVLKRVVRVRKKLTLVQPQELFVFENVDYRAVLTDELQRSLSYDLINLLILEKKFTNFFQNKPYNEVMYLMEYQPWEQMLNKVIKEQNPLTKIKGVIHSLSAVSLPNFFYTPRIHQYLYTPDIVGSNSQGIKEILMKNGFQNDQIFDIEAQRYLHLFSVKPDMGQNNNILLTTSIGKEESHELLDTFAQAYQKGIFGKVFIKAHPDLPLEKIIDLKRLPPFTEIKINLSEAFQDVNTVVVANSSSVLLESLLYGKKTVTLLSLKTLPTPIVREHPLLSLVTSAKEMQEAFEKKESFCNEVSDENLLNADPYFQGWKTFIHA